MVHYAEINQAPPPDSMLQHIGRIATPKLMPRNCLRYLQRTLITGEEGDWSQNLCELFFIKKESGLFDLTRGAYNGAEVCEPVSSFLLYGLSLEYNKTNIGLYRDDGLTVF